jgi:hypothetical protein
MHKTITLLLLIVLFVSSSLGCCSHIKSLLPLTNAGRAELIGNETVALVHTYKGDTKIYCAGVWISETKIMTANHCMEGLAQRVAVEQAIEAGIDPMALQMGIVELPYVNPMNLELSFIVRDEVAGFQENPNAMHQAKVMVLTHDHDLAILQALNVPEHQVAKLAKTTGLVGDKVYAMGHPERLAWSFMEGVVSAYHEEIKIAQVRGPLMQVMLPVWHGNSGGGVFNENGELEGIISFMPPEAPEVGFCIGLESIKGLMAGQKLIKLDLSEHKVDPKL